MTILKKIDETRQEIGSEDVSITPDNFQQLIEQYGTDWAKGYNAALADLKKQIYQEVLLHPKVPNLFSSHHLAGRRIDEFFDNKLTPLLDAANQLLTELQKPDDPAP